MKLPFDDPPPPTADAEGEPPTSTSAGQATPVDQLVDHAARTHATDPTRHIVLEASAGTGKTRVLVDRYVNLLRAGIDPDHILAITFTRKAAAEMRERIIDRLREASRFSAADLARWRDLKDRLSDIAISTIDAFCLSLLREFPLEADVDPAFELADDTEVPRIVAEALDQTFRICRAVAKEDDAVALVFAQLGERRLRAGIAALLDRRLVAPLALRRYLSVGPRDLTIEIACLRAAARLREHLNGVPGGLEPFLRDGPTRHPHVAMLAADIRGLCASHESLSMRSRAEQATFRVLVDRLRGYFLTTDGRPRDAVFRGTEYRATHCTSDAAWKRHRERASAIAPGIAETWRAFRRDLNAIQARGVWRIFAVALRQYQRHLDARALLDFSGVLERAVQLLKGMDEFAQSRFRLEARFRHILVDEFQDTSRAQWELVAQLVRNWGEGMGAGADVLAPSIFIVGDRKQSIYGFRDADVSVLDEAARFVRSLRPDADPQRAISVSFRAVPPLLAFVNDTFRAIAGAALPRRDAFRFGDTDRFPVSDGIGDSSALGLIAGPSVSEAADRVGDEMVHVLSHATVRDRTTGTRRTARPADIAILFRSRDSHRAFERALERRGIGTYVYKGLGFFEADEVQDVVALIRYLADPTSDLRAAALLRSRLIRLSDRGVMTLAPNLASAILAQDDSSALPVLDAEDREVLDALRRAVPMWRTWVDRMPPWELVRHVLQETAYAFELRGAGYRQARENLKKLGAMVRRFQNRGYATLARVADHLEQLAVGDESNATVDAQDAVSLMTVHAAKGLEFPIVFIVNINRGTGGVRAPIRVSAGGDGASIAIADFQSEADEDALAREREETKRLLYVAMTRARDRLYLCGTLKDGVCRMGRGSLGEVLPQSLRDLFSAAVSTAEDQLVMWSGSSGRHHQFRVPRFEPVLARLTQTQTTSPPAATIDDFDGMST